MSFKQSLFFWIFAHFILMLDKCICYFSIIIIMWLYKKLSGFYSVWLLPALFELVLSFLSHVTWVEDSQVLESLRTISCCPLPVFPADDRDAVPVGGFQGYFSSDRAFAVTMLYLYFMVITVRTSVFVLRLNLYGEGPSLCCRLIPRAN